MALRWPILTPLVAALLAGTALLLGCDQSQAPQPGNAERLGNPKAKATVAPGQPLSAIESLLAPVALYPDPLLAELLVTATYPDEAAYVEQVLQQARDNDETPRLDVKLDASVRRLAQLPQALDLLQDYPQWAAALGATLLSQPQALLQAVQTLRQRALHSGALQTAGAQQVLQEGGQVYILPREPGKLALPLYNPEAVFAATLLWPTEFSAGTSNGDSNPAEFYPGYYPGNANGENSAAPLEHSAAIAITGLPTWGRLLWGGAAGYGISHPYGNLVDCADRNDCWLRSFDNGYQSGEALLAGQAVPGTGIFWRYDLRRFPRTGSAKTDKTRPVLAGQQFTFARQDAASANAGARGFPVAESDEFAVFADLNPAASAAPAAVEPAMPVLAAEPAALGQAPATPVPPVEAEPLFVSALDAIAGDARLVAAFSAQGATAARRVPDSGLRAGVAAPVAPAAPTETGD